MNAGTSIGPDDISEAMENLEANSCTPTDLILSPQAAKDIRTYDTFVEADKVGSNEAFERPNGLIGRIYGMNVYMSPNVNISTTYDAYVIDRSRALILGEKRPLTVKDQPDVLRDRHIYNISMRIAATYYDANAICRIYRS